MADDSVDQLTQKRKKLEAQLKAIKAAEDAEKNKRLAVAGEAVIAEAEGNPQFKETLDAILDRRLKGKRKRSLFALNS